MVLLAAEPNPRPAAGVESSVAIAEPTHECLVDLACCRRRLERNEIAGTKIGDDAPSRREPAMVRCGTHDTADRRARAYAWSKLNLDERLPSEGFDLRPRPLPVARQHGLHRSRGLGEGLHAVLGQVALAGGEAVEAGRDRLRKHRLPRAGRAEEEQAALALAARLLEVLAR